MLRSPFGLRSISLSLPPWLLAAPTCPHSTSLPPSLHSEWPPAPRSITQLLLLLPLTRGTGKVTRGTAHTLRLVELEDWGSGLPPPGGLEQGGGCWEMSPSPTFGPLLPLLGVGPAGPNQRQAVGAAPHTLWAPSLGFTR